MRRVGIYPGTFDPVHAGHIAFALATLHGCQLSEVVFLPERSPRGKHNVSNITHRLAQIRNALPDIRIRASCLADDTFTTAKTLPKLLRIFPGSQLTLLIGSDVARRLPCWDDLGSLLKNVSLAIGMRDDNHAEITSIMLGLEKEYGIPVRHTILRSDYAHLASSQLRAS